MLGVAEYLDTIDDIPCNLIIGLGITENVINGKAFKPLDIYKAYKDVYKRQVFVLPRSRRHAVAANAVLPGRAVLKSKRAPERVIPVLVSGFCLLYTSRCV